MKEAIYLMIVQNLFFFVKTIYYSLIVAIIVAPIMATFSYYPEISIPFSCGVLTGAFMDSKRRALLALKFKKLILFIIRDLGFA